MAWLASDFLLELRRAAGLGASSVSPEGLTDAELLPVVDREIQTEMVPLLLRCREEFLVLKQSVTVSAATTRVRIPARTIAGRLRDVRLTVNGVDQRLVRYQPEDKSRLFPTVTAAGALLGYYVEGEWLVLLGSPTTGALLNIYYFARPGRLTVTVDDFRLITVVGAAQVDWSLSWDGPSSVDLVRGSSGLSPLFQDVATDASGGVTNCAISSSITPFLVAGDYVTRVEKSPVVPLPIELHGTLLCRSTAAVLRQLGKYDEASREREQADKLEQVAVGLLTPRVESQPKTVVANFHWRRRSGRGTRFS